MAQSQRPSSDNARDFFREGEAEDTPTGTAMNTGTTTPPLAQGGGESTYDPRSAAFQSDASSPVTDTGLGGNVGGPAVSRVIHTRTEKVYDTGGEVREEITEYTTTATDADADRLLQAAARQQLLDQNNQYFFGYGQPNVAGFQALYGGGAGMDYGSQQTITGFEANQPFISGQAAAAAAPVYYAAAYSTPAFGQGGEGGFNGGYAGGPAGGGGDGGRPRSE